MNGALALVGSGEYLPGMEPVDRSLLSRLEGEARVVCLPTAAGAEGPHRIAYWSKLGVEHFARLGARAEAVTVVDRAGADDEANAARIRAANFVYLSGGRPDYLLKALWDTRAWSAILQVLESGGVVAGCSAGAMIFGERIPGVAFLALTRPAANLLPGTMIIPHYDEIPNGVTRLIRLLTGPRTLIGIEANTALVCVEGAYRTVGTGGVTVWSRQQKKRYTDGQTVVVTT
jgi:cyanophycinase-like exopeptidase